MTTDPSSMAEAGPQRRCIASGRTLPRADLVRFVRDPDGVLVPDVAGRLPGRGVWVAPERDLIARAARKGLFARGLGEPVRADAAISDRVEVLLVRHWLGLLGMARRAGQLALGFEQVRALAASGHAGLLIGASDGAAGTLGRLRALAPQVPCVTFFSNGELSGALGRENVVQAAVQRGRMADRLAREARRLTDFRSVHLDHLVE